MSPGQIVKSYALSPSLTVGAWRTVQSREWGAWVAGTAHSISKLLSAGGIQWPAINPQTVVPSDSSC
jgi:hypothetical protein